MAESPLQFEAELPVRATPIHALAASLLRLRASSGASVATTIMHDPSALSFPLPPCRCVGVIGLTMRLAQAVDTTG